MKKLLSILLLSALSLTALVNAGHQYGQYGKKYNYDMEDEALSMHKPYHKSHRATRSSIGPRAEKFGPGPVMSHRLDDLDDLDDLEDLD